MVRLVIAKQTIRNRVKKILFVDPNDYKEEDAYVGEDPMFNGTDERDEEVFEGDTGQALVVRWMCLTPRTNGDEYCTTTFSNPHVPFRVTYATS